MNIAKMLMNNLPDGALENVAQGAGINTDIVTKVVGAAAPSVAGSLAKNMQSDSGFIEKALGMAESGDEGGIVNIVLGSQAESALALIAEKFGISSSIVKTVIAKIMPFILDNVKSGAITPEMMKAAAGLADGVDMEDVKNIAGAVMGKKSGGVLGMLGGMFGKR